MWLVDTSVWIEVFRRNARVVLDRDVMLDEIVTCPAVVQEVLQGFDHERAYAVARESMLAFPIVDADVPIERWLEAADLYRAARRAGFTIRSGVDCLIAASAMHHGIGVMHIDRDFDAIAKVSPLQVRHPRRR